MTDVTDNSDSASATDAPFRPHTSHWGAFSARWQGDELEVRPHPGDPDPNRIIENFPGALAPPRAHRAADGAPRLARARTGPDDRRGRDEFVPLSWDDGARPARRRADARARHARPGRGVRRLLWLVERRPLPSRAEPGPSLPEHRAWAAMSARSTPTAPARPRCCCRTSSASYEDADQAQRHLGADRRAQPRSCWRSAAWR